MVVEALGSWLDVASELVSWVTLIPSDHEAELLSEPEVKTV